MPSARVTVTEPGVAGGAGGTKGPAAGELRQPLSPWSLSATVVPVTVVLVLVPDTPMVSGTIPGGTVTDGSLTLLDNDVTLALSPASTGEEAGAKTVTFGNSTDSATSGTDYEAVEAFKITIPQGKKSATKTITFTPKDDTLAEDDETITLTGKTPKTSVSSTQLTIDDDDDTGITLTASPTSVSEGGGAKTVTVTAKTDGTTFPAPRHVNVQVCSRTRRSDSMCGGRAARSCSTRARTAGGCRSRCVRHGASPRAKRRACGSGARRVRGWRRTVTVGLRASTPSSATASPHSGDAGCSRPAALWAGRATARGPSASAGCSRPAARLS